MISDREINKLKHSILFGFYKIYHRYNSLEITSDVLTILFKHKYDEHDIALALKSLKADQFINIDFISDDIWSETIILTQKGIDYCYNNRDNKLIRYLKQNHLAIIAIIISIISLFY